MKGITNWFKASIARTIMAALLFVSVVPIILISVLYVRQSTSALTMQMENNLSQLVSSKAEEIELRLKEVGHTTIIAANQAEEVLEVELSQGAVVDGISKYAPDSRQILGLDQYYNEIGGEEIYGDNLSNVYWPFPIADDVIQTQIIQTEALDTVFDGIKSISPDTQWIYVTTPEGMMRLYPWASNDHYPDNWDPREIVFYTVAEPDNNPDLSLQWTAPYVDYAGAGWMVTASVPLFGQNGDYLGVMSHDVTINSLKEIALNINVLDGVGYGFLIDSAGAVIAHPDFQDADATEGTQEEANLLALGSAEFRTIINNMVAGENGLGYFEDEKIGESLLVYAPVESTSWGLGVTVPREEVIAPAVEMRNRALWITVGLIGLALALSYFITQLIHKPLVQLLQGVNQISEDSKADEITVQSFDEFSKLATAFNEMAAQVWERESNLKRKVAAMRIEIDQRKKQKRVDALVETDFFKRLELNVNQLRADVRSAPVSTD